MSAIGDIAPQIVLIAEVLKPDWDHDVLADAIIAADIAGWTPERLLREFARLAAREDASPHDLRRMAAGPVHRDDPVPGAWQRGAALARELLGIEPEDRSDGPPRTAA